MYTHYKQRADAVTVGYGHEARDYVPTIYGQENGNTVWVRDWSHLLSVGGGRHFNEDQTEITLTLPVGHKFSIGFNEEARATTLAALQAAESFMAGFEGDDLQDGIEEKLAAVRAAIAQVSGNV